MRVTVLVLVVPVRSRIKVKVASEAANELLNLQPARPEYEGERPGLDLLTIGEALQELMT